MSLSFLLPVSPRSSRARVSALTCSLFVALLGAASPGWALPFGDVIVFGDSLVDSGNTQNLVGGPGAPGDPTPAGSGYFAGRFSNGPVYVDLINQAINGTNLVESTLGGTNYAFGGARSGADGDFIPDLGAQRTAYLSDVLGSASSTALYIINAGGNDVRDILLGANAATTIAAGVAEIVNTISALSLAGAEHILVAGVGNVGGIPETLAFGPGAAAAGRAASEAFNAALFPAIAPLGAGLSNLFTLDVIGLFDAVLLDPTAFGLPATLNVTDACLSSIAAPPGGPPTCADYAFFDTIHPTGAVQAVMADAAFAAIPEPGTAALVMLGLLGFGVATRTRAA